MISIQSICLALLSIILHFEYNSAGAHSWVQERVRHGKKVNYIKWEEEEKADLMKAYQEVLNRRDKRDFQENLIDAFRRRSSTPYVRSEDSIKMKAYILATNGYVIPAKYNKGVRVKVEPPPRRKLKESEKLGKNQELDKGKAKRLHEEDNFDRRIFPSDIGSSSRGGPSHQWDDLELRLAINSKSTSNTSSSASNQDYYARNLTDSIATPSRKRGFLNRNDTEHGGPWLYLNSANDPFFKDIHHPDNSQH